METQISERRSLQAKDVPIINTREVVYKLRRANGKIPYNEEALEETYKRDQNKS